MTGFSDARITLARSLLEQALNLWDAADLHTIETCNRLLEACAAELRPLGEALDVSWGGNTEEMRSEVLNLRTQISRFVRIVDASSAFARGLSIYFGTTSSTYDASGHAIGLGGS